MPEAHEQLEQAEHTQHISQESKKIALLIAVLALFLSFSETLGKSAQTRAIDASVQSSDTWALYQARSIRMTQVRTAAENMKVEAAAVTDPAVKEAMNKQVEEWQKQAAHYDSEPEKKEGRAQLFALAKEWEHKHEVALAKYEHYELSSAAFQVGIVLASAAVITGAFILAWLGGLLGIAGLAVLGLGFFAPHFVESIL